MSGTQQGSLGEERPPLRLLLQDQLLPLTPTLLHPQALPHLPAPHSDIPILTAAPTSMDWEPSRSGPWVQQ